MLHSLSRLFAASLAAVACVSAAQAADPASGEKVMVQKCAICHSWKKGDPNKMGPNLFGVYGTKAAAIPGYSFSPAMKNSGITWTKETLDSYLRAPTKVVPGTKMAFVGLSTDAQADDVIAYLQTLK